METNTNCSFCNYCSSCSFCNYCSSCSSCFSCDYCSYCSSCSSCSYCSYCNYCSSCSSCDSCDSCNYCYSCNYCKNLKMTEDNLFCWSYGYNSDTSFQQPRYRVFNKQVSEEEYKAIKIPKAKLVFDNNESYTTRFTTAFKKYWGTLTPEQKQEYYDIPHFNWEGFTYITGVEREDDMSGKEVSVVIDGREYKAKII